MRCVELHPAINCCVDFHSSREGWIVDKNVPSHLQNEYSELHCVLVFQVGHVRKEKIIVWVSSGQYNWKDFFFFAPLARLQAGFSALPAVKNKGEEGRKRVNCTWFKEWYKATFPSAATLLSLKSSVGETGCHLEVQSCCWRFLLCASPHPVTASPCASSLHTFFSEGYCLLAFLAPDPLPCSDLSHCTASVTAG